MNFFAVIHHIFGDGNPRLAEYDYTDEDYSHWAMGDMDAEAWVVEYLHLENPHVVLCSFDGDGSGAGEKQIYGRGNGDGHPAEHVYADDDGGDGTGNGAHYGYYFEDISDEPENETMGAWMDACLLEGDTYQCW